MVPIGGPVVSCAGGDCHNYWRMTVMITHSMEFVGALVAAVTVGTLAEYFVHRAMHWGLLYVKGHTWHHESNEPRTFKHDLYDYGIGAAALSWMGFLISTASGFGWMLGALSYTVLAAYSHQIQHANPGLVFWMKRPVHRMHHAGSHIKGNYGILVDWWDRLFGTYTAIELPREMPARGGWLKAYFAIPWR
jgi:sterol desaturase/sphingolipid hydroxylase (fatty acid hydroxylase superfamily)